MKKIALFIDAENVNVQDVNFVFDKLANFGQVVIKRAYADWSNQALLAYKKILLRHAIEAVHEFAYVSKKNSSDIIMIIDIMEILLKRNNIDIFVIVSSDSDFSTISRKIINSEKIALGFGKSTTLSVFKNSCSKFIAFPEKDKKEVHKENNNPNIKIIEIINKIIQEKQLFDWFPTSQLLIFLKEKQADFNIENFGFVKFTSFLESLDIFEINNNNRGSKIRIKRLKNENK